MLCWTSSLLVIVMVTGTPTLTVVPPTAVKTSCLLPSGPVMVASSGPTTRKLRAWAADWPWTAEYVVPGTGMVNFKAAFEYMKAIGFAGSFLHYSEYFVSVPGAKAPVSLLRPNVPTEVPKDLYIANLRRDHDFYAKLIADAGF